MLINVLCNTIVVPYCKRFCTSLSTVFVHFVALCKQFCVPMPMTEINIQAVSSSSYMFMHRLICQLYGH